MIITIIICVTIIIVAFIVAMPVLQSQHYEHLEEVQKKDYELAMKQLELEKEKVRYGK